MTWLVLKTEDLGLMVEVGKFLCKIYLAFINMGKNFRLPTWGKWSEPESLVECFPIRWRIL